MAFKSTVLIILVPLMAAAESLTGLSNGSYYATSIADGDTEIISQREACALAKKELIGYVFGLNTKVTSNVVQTLNEVQLTNKITLDSDKIQLKGVNTNVKSQPQDGRFASTCTMTYPESEAKLELARLAKIRQNLDRDKLHRATYENTDPVRFGRVVVKSNATKSKVFIDDTFWGHAPIEVDRVPLGNHRLSVSADNYVTHIQDFKIELGQVQNLAVTMRRNLATLNLNNLPANSILWIDGIKQPGYGNLSFEPGIKTIRVEAPFYYPYQDKLELTAGAVLNHRAVLIPKKVSIGFISKNQKTDVYVNGAKIGSTPLQKELDVGSYQVDFMGPSGVIHSQAIVVTPSKGFTVEAVGKPVVTQAPKFQNVMLYKDSGLSVVKGYGSLKQIPQFYKGRTTQSIFELAAPTEGFIFVNGRLAGKKIVVIDDLEGPVSIKVEAPNYHSDEVKFFAVSPKKAVPNAANCPSGSPDSSVGITYRVSGKEQTYCWSTPEFKAEKEYAFVLRPDSNNHVKLHLFKKLPNQNSNLLASYLFSPTANSDHAQLWETTIDDWLKLRFKGLPFEKFEVKEANCSFLCKNKTFFKVDIPKSYGTMPAAVSINDNTFGDDFSISGADKFAFQQLMDSGYKAPSGFVADRIVYAYRNPLFPDNSPTSDLAAEMIPLTIFDPSKRENFGLSKAGFKLDRDPALDNARRYSN